MNSALLKFIKWALPFTCILCGLPSQRSQDLCAGCLKDLPILSHPCPQCAQPLAITTAYACGVCQQHAPPFARTHALFLYEAPITRLITGLKFHAQLTQARIFGELLAAQAKEQWYQGQFLPDLIIPVPLHPQRLQQRGFNQALEIARPISALLQIPIASDYAERCKNTQPQMQLPAAERQKNIHQAFKIHNDLSNKTIAVIDDVITTGFTVREFSQALIKAGAARVHIWCIARTARTTKFLYSHKTIC